MAENKATDEQIHREVLAELRWEPRVSPTEIGVAVKDGVVTLSGYVDSYLRKWSAAEAAQRVRGVKAVANDIVVKLPGASEQTDADIARAAVQALESDALLAGDKLQVTVANGWVTLKGEVEWQFERTDAERAVRRLRGVLGVTNQIVVKPRVKPQDLQKNIEDSLVRSVRTDAERIRVEVDGSKVTLKGTVRSWLEKDEAERAAWRAPGITSVDNRLEISF